MSFIDSYQDYIEKGQKRNVLDLLDNCLEFDSPDGLQVNFMWKNEQGDSCSSKWMGWKAVRDNPWWVERVNNRLIAKQELVLDYDPEPNETPESFQQRLKGHLEAHRNYDSKIMGIFSTGSRGSHIHILVPKLIFKDNMDRELMKAYWIKLNQADPTKAKSRCMIACECGPHWKTGKPKRLII